MKLKFLCANHRAWLSRQPDQAVHRCANSFETGWHLMQQANWQEALPHLGCAYDTAEILMTTRVIAPARAVTWFLRSLAGLAQALEKLERTDDCIEVYQAAIDRLKNEATQNIPPELQASIDCHITRLHRERRRMHSCGYEEIRKHTPVEWKQKEIVFH
ncbi:MAG TPA: hypothetical protein VIV27_02900 [Halioglobus sp.]